MLPILLALSLLNPPYGSPPRAVSDLKLSYTADSGSAVTVTLTCNPPAGGHPTPAAACAQLAKAGGNPDRIKPADSVCYLLYKPVTAEITGTWRGRDIAWTHRFGNSCEMQRDTGVLFRF
ncbi:serine protease [Actinoplanes bogorensis]|uniref:Serine protease n=1 Tax=Paractinoplanes bogorensis TaxID=1610840 RepID=A0ABS5YQE6_9ACTN|nr:SSI family serine proteinase inhibitor [Actinoplanes bogorensis]MBU2665660.1 serine protease [Actinoplanes bogorensis]